MTAPSKEVIMNKLEQFKKHQKMLEKAAWVSAKTWHIDIEETRSQAYLIFCEAMEKYDPTRAKLSTYLYGQLQMLNDYCAKQKTEELGTTDDLTFEIVGTNVFGHQYAEMANAMERLETALELSRDAQEILSAIIGREWETPGSVPYRLPRKNTMIRWYKKLGWTAKRVSISWEEVRSWWQAGNHSIPIGA